MVDFFVNEMGQSASTLSFGLRLVIARPFDAFGHVVYLIFLLLDVDPFLVLDFQFNDVIIVIVIKLDFFPRYTRRLFEHRVVRVTILEVQLRDEMVGRHV
jgi:hypothetical protein